MLPAALLLLAVLLLVWAKMSNSGCEQEKEPEESTAEPPRSGGPAARQSPPGRQPQPQPQPGRAGRGSAEHEQLAVYNPAALRRPALAKFVLGSFDENSSDDELMATAFRVGRRRSSLAGVGGTVPEPPTVSALLEPSAGIRCGGNPRWMERGRAGMSRLGREGAYVGVLLLVKLGCTRAGAPRNPKVMPLILLSHVLGCVTTVPPA